MLQYASAQLKKKEEADYVKHWLFLSIKNDTIF